MADTDLDAWAAKLQRYVDAGGRQSLQTDGDGRPKFGEIEMSQITVSRWAATYDRSRRTANPSEEQILEEVVRDIDQAFRESGQTLKIFASCFAMFLCRNFVSSKDADGARKEIIEYCRIVLNTFESLQRIAR